MNAMYYTLKRLYSEAKIDDNALSNAVEKGWITTSEMEEIRKSAEQKD